MNERGPIAPVPRRATTKSGSKGKRRDQIFAHALAAHRDGDLARAAELFEESLHFAEATICWFEAHEHGRALHAITRVPREHGMFRASANAAFKAALALHQRQPYLDQLLPLLESEDGDTSNLELAQSFSAYKQLPEEDLLQQTDRMQVIEGVHDEQDENSEADQGSGAARLGAIFAGRYELRGELGSGASATVFRAHDKHVGADVALKIMCDPLSPEAKERMRREIKLARKLTHESIVRVFDLVVDEEAFGISMELVDGSSLAELLDKRRMALGEGLDCLLQAARALSFAHERGVVHRDVKPANMLLTRGGLVKISDFGIAKMEEEASITRTGMLLGTPHYIAPEQIDDFRKVDQRVDVYALGVVAYEILTGRVPFEGPSVLAILTQHVNAQPTPPRELERSIPADVSALVMAMLRKNPQDRVASCDAVVQALLSFGVRA